MRRRGTYTGAVSVLAKPFAVIEPGVERRVDVHEETAVIHELQGLVTPIVGSVVAKEQVRLALDGDRQEIELGEAASELASSDVLVYVPRPSVCRS